MFWHGICSIINIFLTIKNNNNNENSKNQGIALQGNL